MLTARNDRQDAGPTKGKKPTAGHPALDTGLRHIGVARLPCRQPFRVFAGGGAGESGFLQKKRVPPHSFLLFRLLFLLSGSAPVHGGELHHGLLGGF